MLVIQLCGVFPPKDMVERSRWSHYIRRLVTRFAHVVPLAELWEPLPLLGIRQLAQLDVAFYSEFRVMERQVGLCSARVGKPLDLKIATCIKCFR